MHKYVNVTGNALKISTKLNLEELRHDAGKNQILKAHELVPEVYTQKFTCQK